VNSEKATEKAFEQNRKGKAWIGEDYVRGKNWEPMVKTYKGWLRWASRKADSPFTPVITWMDHRGGYVIALGGQPEKV
jgi:hypothetical protein